MYVQFTYDQAFNDLMMHLREKYPKEIFDIEGIGDQLDLNKFSKKFFSSKVTADASIDANANVPETTVVTYTAELKKPFEKINSYYILWKELRRIFNTTVANEAVERQLNGDIYIHDMHGIGAGLPYSYFGKTVVIVKIDGALKYLPLEDLYDVGLDGHEIKILDHDNTWTDITRIIRHKSHTNLVQLETKNGRCTTVTTDHPVILDGYSEKYANQLNLSDYLQISDSDIPLSEEKYVDIDYAYFLGFLIGDGCIQTQKCVDNTHLSSGSFIICQKDIIDAPIYTVLNKLFDNVSIIKDGRAAYCGRLNDVRNAPDIGHLSINKKLPDDILTWNKSAIKALICGLIDSDGNVEKSGIINIRTIAFSLTQQIGELIRTLNIGKVRTSYAGVYKSKSGFKSNNDVYRVSFRLTDTEMIKYSTKISDNVAVILEPAAKDGRYETTQLNKITEWNTPEYVYDITTESGHFHCQGLIQHNCFNYSTYDVFMKGLPMVTKIKSIPPKHLYAFKCQMEQFVTIAANSTLGATGISDFLLVFSYYAKDVVDTLSDGHFKFASENDAWAFIKETLVSFIYTINLPMRGGIQSSYSNVSIYDHVFLEEMQDMYIFTNGETFDIDFVIELQKLFLDVMNSELKRTSVTFPVVTACLAVDNERNILDKEFLHSMVEKNLEFGFINFFAGKSSTISSCCFDASQEVIVLVDGEPKIVAIGTLDGIVDTKYADTWVKATVVKCKPATPMYKMILENGATTISTGDHIFVTDSGDMAVQDLHSSQKILCNKDYIPIQDLIEIIEEDTPEFVYCFEMLDQTNPYFTLANGIISHNCRLRSDMLEDPGYTNSIGGSSTKIGSLGVVSLNLPRLAVKCAGDRDEYLDELKYLVLLSAKINHAKRYIIKRKIDEGMHPLYSLGFIDLDKQYSTVGINGLYESLEFMGMDILTQDGQDFVIEAMNVINNTNKKCDKLYGSHANCEQVPKTDNSGHYKSSLIYSETPTKSC